MHVEPPVAAVMDEIAIDNRMGSLAAELREAGVQAHIITEFGKAAPAIATAAELDKVDLIVLAEPRGLLEGLRCPSVTANVLARTAAPVLVVPTAATEELPKLLQFGGAQVIVPLDGSALAEKALPMALRITRAGATNARCCCSASYRPHGLSPLGRRPIPSFKTPMTPRYVRFTSI